MWLPGVSYVIGSNRFQNHYGVFSTLNILLQPFVYSYRSYILIEEGEGNQVVLRSHFCSSVPSCVLIHPSRAHIVQLLLCPCKKHYALSRLLSSGRSPYLFLRLVCQLDSFLLCLLPVWKEVNMKRCC